MRGNLLVILNVAQRSRRISKATNNIVSPAQAGTFIDHQLKKAEPRKPNIKKYVFAFVPSLLTFPNKINCHRASLFSESNAKLLFEPLFGNLD